MASESSQQDKKSGISEIYRKKENQRKWIIGFGLALVFAFSAKWAQNHFWGEKPIVQETTGKMNADLLSKQVTKISVIPDYLFQGFEITLKDGSKYKTTGPHIDAKDAKELQVNGVELVYEQPKTDWRGLPTYLLLGILFVAMSTSLFQALGISFKRSATRSFTKFSDVAGNPEAKVAFQEVVDYLIDPKKHEHLGARFPNGIIMAGPPGVGKTLFGRAVAGEANANFMYTSGSDFQSMFMSMSSMKIKAFFARARRNAPCIVFIDEIDAIGGKRLSEGTAIAREMGSTLNQLLVQMDGFEPNSGVVVIAATNRLELLDPALLRSGRFDRHIHMVNPTLNEREEILRIHGKKLKTENFDFRAVAYACFGMSGADLENLVNQAALIAARDGASAVTTAHGHAARNRLRMGDARYTQAATFSAETRSILAKHESGHAVVGMVKGNDPVTHVSVIPRGQSLGQTMMTPEHERVLHEKHHLENHIRMLLGGRAAEIIASKTLTTGASDDLNKASELALDMVSSYGMYEGLLRITEKSSESLRFLAEKEAQSLLSKFMLEATEIIEKNRVVFDAMVDLLEREEEIDGEGMLKMYALLKKNGGVVENATFTSDDFIGHARIKNFSQETEVEDMAAVMGNESAI